MTAYTPKGLPYPSPADPLAQAAQHIKALANTLDTKLASTGFIYETKTYTTDAGGGFYVDYRTQLATIAGLVVSSWEETSLLFRSTYLVGGTYMDPGTAYIYCINPANRQNLPNRACKVSIIVWGNAK